MFIAKQNDLIACIGNTAQEVIDIMTSALASDYIVEETDVEYELFNGKYITTEELEQQKQKQLMKEFFNTSLGYVKRKVTMANGEVRDFLFNIKPSLKIGAPIITYNLDGTQNRGVAVTEEFLTECDRQVYFDFYGVFPPEDNNEQQEEN